MSEKLFSYPTPEENPNCLCLQGGGGMMAAHFCMNGHMTECHAGMSCDEARCSHLPRYSDGELADYTVKNAPAWSIKGIYGGNVVCEILIYAPDEETAAYVMAEWINQTENLSRLPVEYKIARHTDTVEIADAIG